MKSEFWKNFFLILVGIVTGSLFQQLTSGISALSWLSFGLDFATEQPLVLNLSVIKLTFGISLNLSVSVILFVIIALLFGKLVSRR